MTKKIVFMHKQQAATLDKNNRMPMASIALARLFPGLRDRGEATRVNLQNVQLDKVIEYVDLGPASKVSNNG